MTTIINRVNEFFEGYGIATPANGASIGEAAVLIGTLVVAVVLVKGRGHKKML